MQTSFSSKLLSTGHVLWQTLKPSFMVDSFLPYMSVGGVRHKRGRIVNKIARADPETIKHHGFTYYPRFKNEVDPPYEPSKLFMVKKIRSVNKLPHWEKYIVGRHFRLDKIGSIAIVKNTPETNQLLYKIKHVVEIKPITFPYGFPKDPTSGFLDSHGRYINHKLIEGCPEEAQTKSEAVMKKTLDGKTLKHRYNLRWFQRWDVI